MSPLPPILDVALRLSDLEQGDRACVMGIDGAPLEAERLTAMGLGVGACIEVLRTGRTLRLAVGEGRLGLDDVLARSLSVVRL